MSKDNEYIGIKVTTDPATVKEVALAINTIISAPHLDQKTIRCALHVLDNASKINNLTISHCNINMSTRGEVDVKDDLGDD